MHRLRAEAVENFTATRTGFTAETDYDTDRLVFFSVPYDDGFTAAINGEPAKIEKVDNGLMALRVPAGQTSITCTYHTPGLRTGTIISLAALAVYGAYLVVLKKRKPVNFPGFYDVVGRSCRGCCKYRPCRQVANFFVRSYKIESELSHV